MLFKNLKSLKNRYNWNTHIWLGLTDEADEGSALKHANYWFIISTQNF